MRGITACESHYYRERSKGRKSAATAGGGGVAKP